MQVETHGKSLKYLVSYADEMVSDSKNDQQHRTLLLNLAEIYLKKLIDFYYEEKSSCMQGYIYQKLAWVKYLSSDYELAEKHFLYAIINLKNCKICVQQLLESYWGLINTYIILNKIKVAKKYFLSYYRLLSHYPTISLEEDFDYVVQVLNLSVEDLLKK